MKKVTITDVKITWNKNIAYSSIKLEYKIPGSGHGWMSDQGTIEQLSGKYGFAILNDSTIDKSGIKDRECYIDSNSLFCGYA